MFKFIKKKWNKIRMEIEYRRRLNEMRKKDPFTYD
jgi:hypothetical protein